ncbi:MAG: sigma 54-interacting transcriptional regulator [Desulfomonile tiedjei]|uniref:Sigma 54-interacting transcriptional regulator n=1 Tax=Desulfomonile tiedjei TaxID=2358 RepID=A0A9D6Z494_9BACT|nr:sigma 54-interacting transcriptional regulator [Desulfomonile tiedjei]
MENIRTDRGRRARFIETDASSLFPRKQPGNGKNWQEAQEFSLRILNTLNQRFTGPATLREILGEIREFTGLEAVGIRLRSGEDYPYYATIGFPDDFIAAENSLCSRDSNGELVRDFSGNAALKCMCGHIIRGRFDPSQPFFSDGGSFWTNRASQSVTPDSKIERKDGAKNLCVWKGFESVLLVPLKSGNETVGLLQLSDSMVDRFTLEMVQLFELIATGIGMALSRNAAQEALVQAKDRFAAEVAERTRELIESNRQLKQEIAERQAAEERLILAQDGLERRIEHRTAELMASNETLVLEINEHKLTTEALRESEERFRTIYEESPIGIELFDSDGQLIGANRACLEIFGVTDVSDVLGFNLFDDRNVPDGQKAKLSNGETVRYEICFDFAEAVRKGLYKTYKSEGRIFLDVLISPLGIHEHKLKGYLVQVQDVTEQKRAEEALRMSEARFREIYENAPVMIHSINPEGTILNVNRKWLEELGYSREEAIGRPVDFIMTPESAWHAFQEVLPEFWNQGKISDVSYQYVTKQQNVMDILLDSRVIHDPVWGDISLSVIRDVTDHKRAEEELLRSEQRFRAVFESARDCIYVKDQSLRYTHANPAMEKLMGIRADRFLGMRDEDLYGEEGGKHLREVDLRVLQGQSIEEEHSRPIHGVQFVFHDIKVPLLNSEGEIIGICGVSRNVTERKKIQPEARTIAQEYPSVSMQAALSKAHYAAATDSIVLLLGESGSGKDYLARVIHANSKRSNGPFFGINCAAIPPELAESELFGHEAGAFTGARGRKRGLLELAEGGTLLLNEIGELPLYLQSKLLTFLDSKSLLRVGGEKQIQVNARLIAATHRNLEKEVDAGRFLKPLFYRLNVFAIEVPPLRERSEDIPILMEEIMSQLASEMQLTEVPPVDSSALVALCNYHWPGNVREFRNVLERALILSDMSRLKLGLPNGDYNSQGWTYNVKFPEGRTLEEITDEITESLCFEALRRSRGNKKLAAQLLGISRFSLYRHLRDSEPSAKL